MKAELIRLKGKLTGAIAKAEEALQPKGDDSAATTLHTEIAKAAIIFGTDEATEESLMDVARECKTYYDTQAKEGYTGWEAMSDLQKEIPSATSMMTPRRESLGCVSL